MGLPRKYQDLQREIEKYAVEYGLDFFDIIFELVSYDRMNMVAAYGGFPTRYPHWKFGMEFEQLSKGYMYGLQKIYELVINTDPCYAYLLESNSDLDQKMVMAHVYGHCDFFKNNLFFSHTDRKMMDVMANHSTRIRRYIDRFGLESVETFLDQCLSIENLIDHHSMFIKRRKPKIESELKNPVDGENEEPEFQIRSLPTNKEYMKNFINPEEFIEEQRKKIEEKKKEEKKFPEEPEQDILLFLLENAPLKRWQADVLSIIREEAYYFSPQGQTKIMNEGWASYWHSTILTQKALNDSEVIDYADNHSGTMGVQPGKINPYKLGLELFRHIEERWDKGQFGKEWNECDDYLARGNWNRKLGFGRQKVFEVRKMYNDVTFIDEFLTEDFARQQKMFVYGFNQKTNNWEIFGREFKKIKQKLLFSLTNFGQPVIMVEDANFKNRGELLLRNKSEEVDLDMEHARDTITNVCAIWKRPVNLYTVFDSKRLHLRFDGKEHTEKVIETLKKPQ